MDLKNVIQKMNWKLHVVQYIICTSFCCIYGSLGCETARGTSLISLSLSLSLSHTHILEPLVAILLNNKHPTFQLDLIRKVCRSLHDTIVLTFYIYGIDCQKKYWLQQRN